MMDRENESLFIDDPNFMTINEFSNASPSEINLFTDKEPSPLSIAENPSI